MKRTTARIALAVLAASASLGAAHAQSIVVDSLDDLTGPTSANGKEFAAAKNDVVKWINANGGINGKKLELTAFDYSYKAPVAVTTYKK